MESEKRLETTSRGQPLRKAWHLRGEKLDCIGPTSAYDFTTISRRIQVHILHFWRAMILCFGSAREGGMDMGCKVAICRDEQDSSRDHEMIP